MAKDLMLIATQEWLKSTYGDTIDVPTDGTGRAVTIKGLIKALQLELSLSADGIWGNDTASSFDKLFPDGLNENSYINETDDYIKYKIINIIYILQGGFYTSRGINPGGLNGEYTDSTRLAVQRFQAQVGIEQTGKVKSYLLQAILTTDVYELQEGGDENTRVIQQELNKKYYDTIPLIPTNGIYERATNIALIKAIQKELGVDVDGWWGEGTMRVLPTLRRYGTVENKQMVYILQYLLYLNGYDPNGFDGGFGAGVQSAVKLCQADYNLTSDGICGRQTWSALIVSCGDNTRKCTACDTVNEITESRAQILYDNGYRLVGRYLTNVINGKTDKCIKDGELNNIFNAKLKVFPIYQDNGRNLNDFLYSKGLVSAYRAIRAAKNYGFPRGTTIFFAVDMDLYESQIISNVVPYFEGIKRVFLEDNNYKIGAYGARQVCDILYNNKLIEHLFLADASYKFSGNIAKRIPKNWDYDQFDTDISISDFSIDKISDRGSLEGISSLDFNLNKDNNSLLYIIIEDLYQKTEEYLENKKGNGNYNNYDVSHLVLQALRIRQYNNFLWNATAGVTQNEYLEYINELYNLDNLSDITVYIDEINKDISIRHLAVVAEAFLSNNNLDSPLQNDLVNLTGSIGDLLQLGAGIQTVYGDEKKILSSDIMFLIGCESDEIAQMYNFESSIKTGYGYDDFYSDIDGVNIANLILKNDYKLNVAFKEYYTSRTNKRFSSYVETLKMADTSKSSNEIKESIERHALNFTVTHYPINEANIVDPTLIALFKDTFGTYNVVTWGEELAKGYAIKLQGRVIKEKN